jgi:tetratricopeptide (TPR) repeat protein
MPSVPYERGDRRKAEDFFNKALNAHDGNDLATALDLYAKAIQADPSMEVAYNNLGMVYIDMGNMEEARRYLNKAIEAKPDYPEPYNNLGFVLRRMGDEPGSASAYLKFLEFTPDADNAEKIKAWAEGVLAQSGIRGPSQSKPVSGTMKPVTGKKAPKAGEVIAVGSASPTKEVENLFEGDDWLKDEGTAPAKPATAVPRPAQAAGGTPRPGASPAARPGVPGTGRAAGESPSMMSQAEQAYEAGEFEKAVELYTKICGMDPKNTEAISGKGGALVKLGRIDEGLEVLRDGIEMNPRAASLYYIIGFALRGKGDDQAAVDAFEQYLRLVPDAEDAGRIRAWMDEVRPAAEMSQEERHYNAALTAFQEGDMEKAQVECEEALFIDESHGPANLLLGRIAIRNGDYIRAVAALRKAGESRPNDPEVFFYLGQAFEKRGLNEEARQSYEKVLEVSPEGPRAQRVREWLEKARDSGEVSLGLRCEYCLKQFEASELFDYQGKKACRECLSHLGINADDLVTAGKEEDLPEVAWEDLSAIEERAPKKRSCLWRLVKAGFATIVVVIVLLGAGIGVVRAGLVEKEWLEVTGIYPLLRERGLQPIFEKIEIDISAPKAADVPGVKHGTEKPGAKAITAIKITSTAPTEVEPLDDMNYVPAIETEGKGEVTFSLKEAPAGASINPKTGEVIWTPSKAGIPALPFEAAFNIVCEAPGVTATQKFLVGVKFGVGKRFSFNAGLTSTAPADMLVADLSGDGQDDIAIGYGRYDKGSVSVFYRNTAVSFSGSKEFGTGGETAGIGAVDANNDGLTDLVALSRYGRKVRVFLQDKMSHLLVPMDDSPEMATGSYPLWLGTTANNGLYVTALDQGGVMFRYDGSTGVMKREVLATPGPISVYTRLLPIGNRLAFVNLPGIGMACIAGQEWGKVEGIGVPVDIVGRGARPLVASEGKVYLVDGGGEGVPKLSDAMGPTTAIVCGMLTAGVGGAEKSRVLLCAEGVRVTVLLDMGGSWMKCPPVDLPARPVLPAYSTKDDLVVLLLENGEVWGIGRR